MSARILFWVANWNLSRAQADRLLGSEHVVDMVDCIHANVTAVLHDLHSAQVVAGYDTGSPDIRWTTQDWGQIPAGVQHLHIDQSNSDLPMLSEVKEAEDVESGAKQIGVAVKVAEQRHAHRLDAMIYCSQSVLPELEGALTAAGLPHGTIIGYQYQDAADRDLSVIREDLLPSPIPHGPEGTFRAVVDRHADGRWEIHRTIGVHERTGGPEDVWDEARIGVDRARNRWRIEHLQPVRH